MELRSWNFYHLLSKNSHNRGACLMHCMWSHLHEVVVCLCSKIWKRVTNQEMYRLVIAPSLSHFHIDFYDLTVYSAESYWIIFGETIFSPLVEGELSNWKLETGPMNGYSCLYVLRGGSIMNQWAQAVSGLREFTHVGIMRKERGNICWSWWWYAKLMTLPCYHWRD